MLQNPELQLPALYPQNGLWWTPLSPSAVSFGFFLYKMYFVVPHCLLPNKVIIKLNTAASFETAEVILKGESRGSLSDEMRY